jgi:Flp pilus assembly protein TadB
MTEMTRNRPSAAADASTGELVRQAADQISRLVRDELALAKAEMAEKGKRAGIGAGLLGGGGLIALYGLAALLTAAVLGLAVVVPAWLAALIVALVLFAIAGAMALAGRTEVKQATPPVPEEAARSVKADVDEVKERAHR